MNYSQKKLSLIAFIALWVSIFIIAVAQVAKPAEASASNNWISNPPYYSPRTVTTCWNNFYGQGWQSSIKYEGKCRKLWDLWTKEEIEGYTTFHEGRSYNSKCDWDGLPEDECRI